MKLHIDFIPQRNIPWFGIIVLLVSICWTCVIGNEWWELTLRHAKLEERSRQLEVTIKEKKRSFLLAQKTASPVNELRQKEFQKIHKVLFYSWNQVFAPIEETEEPGVAILSLAHNQSTEHTQLLVEAIDTAALVRYVEKLNEYDESGHWYISNYQMQTQSMPNTVKGTILNK